MLFTTATFAFLYLPLVLAGFFLLGKRWPVLAALWLFVASLFFYGYWMPEFTLLLLASICTNFYVGQCIAKSQSRGRLWLSFGVVSNLCTLAYFKYFNFFVENLNTVLGFDWQFTRVILPIGISFYTFTQIAYLVDTWQGKVRESRFVHYGLFVTYFPHLIAGPVLHHSQMMPQFRNSAVYRFNSGNFSAGMAIFCIGLFKKVVLADGIAPYADAVFNPVDAGMSAGAAEAWLGAVAYTLQLYFDFSGYSDMAIGLSWMFNIKLPFNFDSPYKALNIGDFWRRWHISLSTFLRDYLYIPLGGNRNGAARRYVNLATTMVLGGLWHGASWSFVIWGALHGTYLMLNHGFQSLMAHLNLDSVLRQSIVWRMLSWSITIFSVVIAWVFFRAATLSGAMHMVAAMAGQSSADVDGGILLWNAGLKPAVAVGWCVVLALAAVLLPNSNRIGEWFLSSMEKNINWRAAVFAAATVAAASFVVLNTTRDSISAFIYFNF